MKTFILICILFFVTGCSYEKLTAEDLNLAKLECIGHGGLNRVSWEDGLNFTCRNGYSVYSHEGAKE